MKKYALLFVVVFIVSSLCVPPETVSACSPNKPPAVKEKFNKADAVFSGKVLSVKEQVFSDKNTKEFTAVFLVDEYWKGDVSQYVQFVSSTYYPKSSDLMTCSFDFVPQVGKEYLIYSDYSKSKDVYERIEYWYEVELTDSNRADSEDLDFLDDGETSESMQNPFPLSTYTFDRDLSLGTSHESVRSLQVRLNQLGYTVAESGPGSKGSETIYFGPATKAALIRFQNAHLIPLGITQGTGYFGPLTRNLFSNTIVE